MHVHMSQKHVFILYYKNSNVEFETIQRKYLMSSKHIMPSFFLIYDMSLEFAVVFPIM